MLASNVMRKPVVIHAEAPVEYALGKMRESGHRHLPVVDDEGRAVGLFSSLAVIGHLVPDYIVSGDLDDIPYAPDFGLLREHYEAVKSLPVSQLMVEHPFMIKPEESLLSAAAALVTHPMFDAVLVSDGKDGKLVGIITSTDVIEALSHPDVGGAHAS